MRKPGLIILLTSLCLVMNAQIAFKTLVTKGPVTVGQPFQVQYVLETSGGKIEFYEPDFKGFRLIDKNIYEGIANGTYSAKGVTNYVFNLEASKPGKFTIPIAAASIDNQLIKSSPVTLEVIDTKEADRRAQALAEKETNFAYFLKPGDDPQKKIRDNLFLKVMVDKKSCFVGEPVTATFKLYSRMISRSDIVKNPGFYGFTVLDIIGLDDNKTNAETINGKKFDVHTIRKVQLYPLRAGSFTIDPMEVSNEVDFTRSSVNIIPEQKITEGVYAHPDPSLKANTETYTSSMSSAPITITVKPAPEKNQPTNYNGATGQFSIAASIDKNELAKNEEGKLTIIISGKGNFTQLGAPVVHWPDSLEGFEPKVTDSLDKNYSPLKGTRVFQYFFVSAKSGQYIIPAITFSFFDPDSATYKTVSTKASTITITNQEKINKPIDTTPVSQSSPSYIFPLLLGFLLIVMAASWILISRQRSKKKKEQALAAQPEVLPAVATLMKPAYDVINDSNRIFYSTCEQCAWKFFAVYFGLTGSNMNNRYLATVMQQKGIDEKNQRDILDLLEECKTGIFAGAEIETDKAVLLQRMTTSLEQIIRYL